MEFDIQFNASSRKFPRWESEPNQRGSFGILSTCLITMTLCVWTAVHLNVPAPSHHYQQYWRKFCWLLLGLFAPELVALTAFCQYRDARKLCTDARVVFGQQDSPSKEKSLGTSVRSAWLKLVAALQFLNPFNRRRRVSMSEKFQAELPFSDSDHPRHKSRPQWTITHSFYALMGGFAFEPPDKDVSLLPDMDKQPKTQPQRLTLGPLGINMALMYDPLVLPAISEAEIWDKSKANNLSKTLVCLQALWFCAQCFARWGQHLHVSLLELNAFAHSLCALTIYFMWWQKPLDVEEPTYCRGERADIIEPYLSLNSYKLPILGQWRFWSTARVLFKVPGLRRVLGSTRHWLPVVTFARKESLGLNDIPFQELVVTDQGIDIYPGQVFGCFIFRGWYRPGRTYDDWQGFNSKLDLNRPLHLDAAQIHRWKVTADSCRRLDVVRQPNANLFRPSGKEMFVERCKNLPAKGKLTVIFSEDERWPFTKSRLTIGFAIAGIVYGGLHLTAWNTNFPTKTEGLIWRISATVLASSGLLGIAYGIFRDTFLHNSSSQAPLLDYPRTHTVLRALSWCVVRAFLAIYVLCRLYIVVESFWNLAALPDDSFKTPQWSQYVPHIY